jgi:hypothetical protein
MTKSEMKALQDRIQAHWDAAIDLGIDLQNKHGFSIGDMSVEEFIEDVHECLGRRIDALCDCGSPATGDGDGEYADKCGRCIAEMHADMADTDRNAYHDAPSDMEQREEMARIQRELK